MFLKHAQVFFGQRGLCWNGWRGKGNFNSNGRGFASPRSYNGNHNPQRSDNIPNG